MTSYIDVPTKTLVTPTNKTFAYREIGVSSEVPVIGLIHLSGNLDNWDPTVIDGLAQEHHLILPDYQGVGGSGGKAAPTIQGMAKEIREFIHALGFKQIDLFGFSMGGFVAQEVINQEPTLIRRALLTGTGPRGGQGIRNVTKISDKSLAKAIFTFTDVKTYLFFTRTNNGKHEAAEFLKRIKTRQTNRDRSIGWPAYRTQLKAINQWGSEQPIDFSKLEIPVLVANGDHDAMVPTKPNSYDLAKAFPNSKLVIYPDAGHAGVFQFSADFVKQANQFLK
ncbi:alpha/beta fold hydrolase [Levilactobacillus tongjiangensis]|uniref:Alpha/beta fold hydrolase n=1 Tax=Levilactobacillus tongjiangensis TaxID=2486023 RepID=A0ABW1SPG0_9LACO|nr:alpha/beta hydrolase [Levilactobacillus tongjiangensis]